MTGAPLDERIAAFVDATWRHARSPLAFSALEIRLATLRTQDPRDSRFESHEPLAEAWARTWNESLGLEGRPERSILRLSLMTTSYLSGLATMTRLSPVPATAVQDQIEFLNQILIRELLSVHEPDPVLFI
jgi:hypothetical protein